MFEFLGSFSSKRSRYLLPHRHTRAKFRDILSNVFWQNARSCTRKLRKRAPETRRHTPLPFILLTLFILREMLLREYLHLSESIVRRIDIYPFDQHEGVLLQDNRKEEAGSQGR